LISTKPLRCKHCEFEVQLVTKIDGDSIADGFASHTGWGSLRDHIMRVHPVENDKLDEWIYGSTTWKLPTEVIEREARKAERECGMVLEAA
jgi:hypothetical protein